MLTFLARLVIVIFCLFAKPGDAAEAAPMVMLKLDDLVRHGKGAEATVSARWQKVTDFIVAQQVKANYGLICESLEGDCPVYVAWLKALVASGRFEIWNHGYYNRFPPELVTAQRTGEFLGASAAEQGELLNRSLRLVQEKTGIVMCAYGPHGVPLLGGDAAAAYAALAGIPAFKLVFFYAPPAGTTSDKVVVPRLMELEKPLFVPNSANVQAAFEAKGHNLPLIAIQGHPNQWDDARFAEFVKAVRYLQDQGCRFVTVSEYLTTLGAGKTAP